MASNDATARARSREPDTGREAVIDPWQAATDEHTTEQGGWLLSYLDVMTLLFSFFVMLFAYQKALTVEAKAARAESAVKSAKLAAPIANGVSGSAGDTLPIANGVSGSAGDTLPIANGRSGSAGTTLPIPVSPAVVSASKAVSTDRASASPPVRKAVDTSPIAAPVIKIQPAYPMSTLALAAMSRGESEGEDGAVDTHSARQTAEETSRPTERTGQPVPAVPESDWIAEAGSVAASFDKAFADPNLGSMVEISAASGEVRLEINDAILFDPASAELKREGASVLDRLASVLGTQGGTIAVEGHTDDRPIATAKFQSNWELSTARASTVTRYLIAHGVSPERLRAVGLADTQPREANDTPEGRARNRRVSIVMFLPRGSGVRT
jgi:chemotaxis protein MotB